MRIHPKRAPQAGLAFASAPLLPQSAETVVTDYYGVRRKNSIEFSGCREYSSQSTIHFGAPVPEPPRSAPRKK